MKSEQLNFDTPEAVRFPLTGIPLKEMLEQINSERKYIHFN